MGVTRNSQQTGYEPLSNSSDQRFSRTGYVAGLALFVAITLIAHVIPTGDQNDRVRRTIFDIGHVIGFAGFTALLATVMRRERCPPGLSATCAYVVAAILAFGLAVLSEAVQGLTGRDASTGDLLRDIGGISVGLLIAIAFALRPARRLGLILLGVIGLTVMLQNPIGVFVATATARLNSTHSFGFESPLERHLVESAAASVDVVAAPSHWQRSGNVLRVRPDGKRQRILFFGMPRDWSGYSALRFTVAADSPELRELVLRVDSSGSSNSCEAWFRKRVAVGTEPKEITISIDEIAREFALKGLDITDISHIRFLAWDAAGMAFYLDDLRLE
jgi:VanZ family protein